MWCSTASNPPKDLTSENHVLHILGHWASDNLLTTKPTSALDCRSLLQLARWQPVPVPPQADQQAVVVIHVYFHPFAIGEIEGLHYSRISPLSRHGTAHTGCLVQEISRGVLMPNLYE